jgi:TrbL/VirB6 plasmid conjugal transfer protein
LGRFFKSEPPRLSSGDADNTENNMKHLSNFPALRLFTRRCLRGCVLLISLLGIADVAMAEDESFPIAQAFTGMQNFANAMTGNIETALGTAQVSYVANVLFTTLALSFFIWKFVGFAMRGFDVMDILEVMLTIMFVYVLQSGYQTIFPAIYSAGRYIGDAIGNGILKAPPGGSLAEAMMGMFARSNFTPQCGNPLDFLGPCLPTLIAAILATVSVLLLGAIAVLVELWTIWGFAIAYAIGWVTIPFLMYERLSFLFEGWLKFFFGVTVYAIVAKANLALVFLGIEMVLGLTPGVNSAAPNVPIVGMVSVLGLLVFVAVGIFSLTATGSFASSIVMGAGGGGVGGAVQSMARTAASAASGGAGALAGAVRR